MSIPFRHLVWICLLLTADVFAAGSAAPPPYRNHRDLTVVIDAQGREQPVKSAADWARRREHILLGMQQAMGPLPSREKLPPLDVKVSDTLKRNEYTRLTITFVAESIAGKEDRVPAYLYLPDAASPTNSIKPDAKGRRPAILALHQTHALGKGDVDFEKGRTNRCFASELAARGYVVLAPDYPSFGDYKYDFAADSYVSGTMKGIFNHMRAVDLLQGRDEVDGDRIGVIGHSLGGHNAMFVAAFDTRLKAVVSSCGWTPFHEYYGGKIAGWTSDRYMPRLRDVYQLDADRVPFDFYEVVAALAPRGFYSCSPLHDSNFDVEGVRKAHLQAKAIYGLLNAAENLVIDHPDCGHDFPALSREASYKFLDEQLKAK